MPDPEALEFDSEKHVQQTRVAYRTVRSNYENISLKVSQIIKEAAQHRGLPYHSITHRAKDEDSLATKAAKPKLDDPRQPKYPDPLRDITDLAGVRVITFFVSVASDFEKIITDEFFVLERSDKSEALWKDEKFGYRSVHFLVRLKRPRIDLSEYRGLAEITCEVQIRTILQHAWAEIEHDIGYKTRIDMPPEIRRRFLNLAGLLEIADREFQIIRNEEVRIREGIRNTIVTSPASDVPITGDAIQILLDHELGSDARLSEWSYNWIANIAIELGLKTIADIRKSITKFDWDIGRRFLWRTKPSPPSVLHEMLFLDLEEHFIEKHPWANEKWFTESRIQKLKVIRDYRKTNRSEK